ncbi:MAG: Plug domain-containing protein [Aliidongia sp.]
MSLNRAGPGQTEFELRGLTSSGGSSPTVGFYLDDTPLTAPATAQNGKVVIDPNVYDLNRVEVLRGPQGTLYGSGSEGGTIKIITNQPDLTKIDASAQTILSGTDGGGFNMAKTPWSTSPSPTAPRLCASSGRRPIPAAGSTASCWRPAPSRWRRISVRPAGRRPARSAAMSPASRFPKITGASTMPNCSAPG